MMYGMFKYLESNNLLNSFDNNALSCQHYIPNFNDDQIKFGITPIYLIDIALREWFKQNNTSWGSWSSKEGEQPNIILKGETEVKPFSFFEELIKLKRI